MSARMSLQAFLNNAKIALQQGIANRSKLTFVIGNESADLDSLISSIIYAYLGSSITQPKFGSLYIPISNIPAKDIRLRPEFLALLPQVNVEPEHIITLDDLPPIQNIQNQLPAANIQFILVDHNVLQGDLGKAYSSEVIGCIDHHVDESKVPKNTDPEPRIIEKSGSCTSLVVEYFRQSWRELRQTSTSSQNPATTSKEHDLWDSQIARLGLASILIDTMNLQDENKTTVHDIDAVGYLESKVSGFDRTAFYSAVQDAKLDIGRLTLHEILRKDYKQWTAGGKILGISSLIKPLSFLTDKAETEESGGLVTSLRSFAEDRKLDVCAVMSAFSDQSGKFCRELLLLSCNPEANHSIENFEKCYGPKLGLHPIGNAQDVLGPVDNDVCVKVWHHGAAQYSRKEVAPMLRESLEKSVNKL